MKKASQLLVTGAAITLLPLAAAFAQSPSQQQTPDPAQQPQQQGATFESLDTNNDGRISRAEAEANANVKAQFSSYDMNGDGYIERTEVNSTNNSQSETPKQ
jgi:Ca2+-binding EF-hand superfamily protein